MAERIDTAVWHGRDRINNRIPGVDQVVSPLPDHHQEVGPIEKLYSMNDPNGPCNREGRQMTVGIIYDNVVEGVTLDHHELTAVVKRDLSSDSRYDKINRSVRMDERKASCV